MAADAADAAPSPPAAPPGTRVADADAVAAFAALAPADRPAVLPPPLWGVLAETATTGLVR